MRAEGGGGLAGKVAAEDRGFTPVPALGENGNEVCRKAGTVLLTDSIKTFSRFQFALLASGSPTMIGRWRTQAHCGNRKWHSAQPPGVVVVSSSEKILCG